MTIIEKHFEDLQVVSQDFLGSNDRIQKIVALVPDQQLQVALKNEMTKYNNSSQRWEAFKRVVTTTSTVW